jgi:hypothetical protein
MTTEPWVSRPGPIGSLQEQQYYRQPGAKELAPPLTRVRRLLKELGGEPPDRIMAREPDALGGFQPTDHEVSRLEVLSALTRLSPRDQQIIELAFLRSWERRTIAQQLDCVERTVYRRLRRSLVTMVLIIWDYSVEAPDCTVEDPEDDGQQSCKECGARPGHSFIELLDGMCPSCRRYLQRTVCAVAT